MRVNIQYIEVKQIMEQYNVSQATAYRAKARGWLLVNDDGSPRSASQGREAKAVIPKGFGMSEADAARIAKLSAQYVVGRQHIYNNTIRAWVRDYDLYMEAYQCALIRLWTTGARDEALCFKIGRRAALDALKSWRSWRAAFLDELEDTYTEPEDSED